MNKKSNIFAFFLTLALSLSAVGCATAENDSVALNSEAPSEHSFTFTKDTELVKDSETGEYKVDTHQGPDSVLAFSLSIIHSTDEEYIGRTTPHYVGKQDGNDSFLFFYDLQVDEGFAFTMRVPNIQRFSFDYYLSDNEDENFIRLFWEVDSLHPLFPAFYDKSKFFERRSINAGEKEEVYWSHWQVKGNFTYNYIYIKVFDNRRDSTFRLNNLKITWVS